MTEELKIQGNLAAPSGPQGLAQEPQLWTVGAPLTAQQAAVLDAACEWWCERAPENWGDASLAHAIIDVLGDWEGCEGCDFECGEPCVPTTAAEQHRSVDCYIAQLVHDGKLGRHEGYEPPTGWVPLVNRRRQVS